jgi:flagellar hook protein FlgE
MAATNMNPVDNSVITSKLTQILSLEMAKKAGFLKIGSRDYFSDQINGKMRSGQTYQFVIPDAGNVIEGLVISPRPIDEKKVELTITNMNNSVQANALESVTDSSGRLSNTEGQVVIQTSFFVSDSNLDEDGNPRRQTLNINLGTIGSFKDTITQSASKSTTKAFYQDGYTMGYLDNFKIDSSGIITGVYSNGTNRTIGQIALASFANDRGLEKAGDNTYVESNNSGMARIGESGVAGKGTLMAGALEMSNVDLSEQMTDMIVTQRGFQSNAKTITTADTLLETVLSLKR